MSVCNVKRRNLLHLLPDQGNCLVLIDHPHTMCNLIFLCEVIFCQMILFPLRKKTAQSVGVAACQVNRACVCIAHIHMIDAVQFLIRSGKLMLLHHIVQIIVNGSTACNSSLYLPFANQFIYVITGLMVLGKNPLLFHLKQILLCLLIYLRVIKPGICRKIHLRSVHMQKRIRILFSDCCGFLPAHHIIRKCCYCRSLFPGRS